MNYIIRTELEKELCHHGVLGMHWGIRRYQNKNGTLTPAGRKHMAKSQLKEANKYRKKASREYGKAYVAAEKEERAFDKADKAIYKDNKKKIDKFEKKGQEFLKKRMESYSNFEEYDSNAKKITDQILKKYGEYNISYNRTTNRRPSGVSRDGASIYGRYDKGKLISKDRKAKEAKGYGILRGYTVVI